MQQHVKEGRHLIKYSTNRLNLQGPGTYMKVWFNQTGHVRRGSAAGLCRAFASSALEGLAASHRHRVCQGLAISCIFWYQVVFLFLADVADQ